MATITVDRPTATDPRTVIVPALFGRLVNRIRADHPTHAERIMEYALAFLSTCAANPGTGLGPPEHIDINRQPVYGLFRKLS